MGSMAQNPPSLGARIRRARERAQLSQEELAGRVGASVRALGDWERDRRKPRNRLGALEEVLGVSLDGEQEQAPAIPATLFRDVMAAEGLTYVERQAVITAIEATLARERGAPAAAASPPPGGASQQRRPAS
jgi:transcriptional regulator with XRE-family HTH domain